MPIMGLHIKTQYFYIFTAIDLCIVVLLITALPGGLFGDISLVQVIDPQPMQIILYSLYGLFFAGYSVWFLSAIPRCLFVLAYAWRIKRIPYSPFLALVALLLDAGYVVLRILTYVAT